MNLKNNIPVFLLCLALLSGCGKTAPTAPQTSTTSDQSLKSTQTYKPAGIIYEARLAGDSGEKPWYWFDGNDNLSLNARIRVISNNQSSKIDLDVYGTWGKVYTFPISYANTTNANVSLRIFVPSHSNSTAWKMLIQEEGGAWRNWVLQDSTGYTGYKDYDMTAILADINAGSGEFTIQLIVEGTNQLSYIEVAELYVYLTDETASPSDPYWTEGFAPYMGAPGPTPGWFTEVTNPGFHGTINNAMVRRGYISGDPVLGGKVMSPILPWDPARCQTVFVGIPDSTACFSVYIQEQQGAYRQWQIPITYTGSGYTGDLTAITALSAGDSFSLTISDVFGDLWIDNSIKIY